MRQKDECKCALLCIANMYVGLALLSRGHDEAKRRQNPDICRTDIGVWLVTTMHHNALVVTPYIMVAMQNVLVMMYCNAKHTVKRQTVSVQNTISYEEPCLSCSCQCSSACRVYSLLHMLHLNLLGSPPCRMQQPLRWDTSSLC